MQPRFLLAALLAPITLIISPVALAHAATAHGSGLVYEIMHPLAGSAHPLIMLAGYITALFLSAGLLLKFGAFLRNALTVGKAFSKARS